LLAEMPDRFSAQERRFVREWLGIDFTASAWNKDTSIYPLYSAALNGALESVWARVPRNPGIVRIPERC